MPVYKVYQQYEKLVTNPRFEDQFSQNFGFPGAKRNNYMETDVKYFLDQKEALNYKARLVKNSFINDFGGELYDLLISQLGNSDFNVSWPGPDNFELYFRIDSIEIGTPESKILKIGTPESSIESGTPESRILKITKEFINNKYVLDNEDVRENIEEPENIDVDNDEIRIELTRENDGLYYLDPNGEEIQRLEEQGLSNIGDEFLWEKLHRTIIRELKFGLVKYEIQLYKENPQSHRYTEPHEIRSIVRSVEMDEIVIEPVEELIKENILLKTQLRHKLYKPGNSGFLESLSSFEGKRGK